MKYETPAIFHVIVLKCMLVEEKSLRKRCSCAIERDLFKQNVNALQWVIKKLDRK